MDSDTPVGGNGFTAKVGAPTGGLNIGGSAAGNLNTGIITHEEISGLKIAGNFNCAAVYFNYNMIVAEPDTKEIERNERDGTPSDSGTSTVDDIASQFPQFGDDEETRCLPIHGVSIDVEISSTVSRTTLRQTFSNSSSCCIREAKYAFPIYNNVAVMSFRCIVGGTTVLGKIKSKSDAKSEYSEALDEGLLAALLGENLPEIFIIHLGNIPPESRVIVELVYVENLRMAFNGVTFAIPTSVAPRYLCSETPECLHDENGEFIESPTEGLRIDINIISVSLITRLESRTHHISSKFGISNTCSDLASPVEAAEFDLKKAHVSFWDKMATLSKDFVLSFNWDIKSHALLDASSDQCRGPALMLNICPRELFPQHFTTQELEGEIIFVVESSNTMTKRKARKVQQVMEVFLHNLPRNCHFNIYLFGSRLTALWKMSKQHSLANVTTAKQYIFNWKTKLGDKNLFSVLKYVVEQRLHSTAQVIILADGDFGRTTEVDEFVAKAVRDSRGALRFFPLAFMEKNAYGLVEGIPQIYGGFGELMGFEDSAQLLAKVKRVLGGACSPWSFEIMFEVTGVRPPSTQAAYIQVPCCLHSLYPFKWSTVFLLFEDNINAPRIVTIKATTVAGDVIYENLPVEYARNQPFTIHHLAAKAAIHDLETGQSLSRVEIAAEAERIGLKWSIAGKWTSYVAVSDANKDGIAGVFEPVNLSGSSGGNSTMSRGASPLPSPIPPPAVVSRGLPNRGDRPKGSRSPVHIIHENKNVVDAGAYERSLSRTRVGMRDRNGENGRREYEKERAGGGREYDKLEVIREFERLKATRDHEKVRAARELERLEATREFERLEAIREYERLRATKEYERLKARREYEELGARKSSVSVRRRSRSRSRTRIKRRSRSGSGSWRGRSRRSKSLPVDYVEEEYKRGAEERRQKRERNQRGRGWGDGEIRTSVDGNRVVTGQNPMAWPWVHSTEVPNIELLLGLLLFIILENPTALTLICCLVFLYMLYGRWQAELR